MYLLPNTTRKFSVLYISIMRNGFLMGNIWHLMPWHIYLSRIVLVPLTTMLGSKLSSIHRQAKRIGSGEGDLHSYTIYQPRQWPGRWRGWQPTRGWLCPYAPHAHVCCQPKEVRERCCILAVLPFSLDLELPKHSRPSFLYFMYWRLR